MKLKLKAGKLVLTTENTQDRKDLAGKCDDPYKLIKVMEGDNFSKEYGTKKRPYLKVSTDLPDEFLLPFYKLVEERTKKQLEKTQTVDLLPLIDQGHKGIQCTYTTLKYVDGIIKTVGYIDSEAWNGLTIEEYAQDRFDKLLKVMFGVEWMPAEYYTASNNSLVQNPKYACGHRLVKPFLVQPDDFSTYHWKNWANYDTLDKHWFTNLLFGSIKMSKGQQAIIKGYNILHKEFSGKWWSEYQGWHVEPTEDVKKLGIGKPCSWSSHAVEDKLYITREEFEKVI